MRGFLLGLALALALPAQAQTWWQAIGGQSKAFAVNDGGAMLIAQSGGIVGDAGGNYWQAVGGTSYPSAVTASGALLVTPAPNSGFVTNPLLGTFYADGGAFNSVTALGASQTAVGTAVGVVYMNSLHFLEPNNVDYANIGFSYGGDQHIGISNSIDTPGLCIGGSYSCNSTLITNIGVGACTMSAGTTCTATTTGTTSASLCQVTPNASYAGTYYVTPGAGTTVVTASIANSVKFTVHCDN